MCLYKYNLSRKFSINILTVLGIKGIVKRGKQFLMKYIKDWIKNARRSGSSFGNFGFIWDLGCRFVNRKDSFLFIPLPVQS